MGRLDAATSGLLLLTNDTKLADWLMDPGNAVVRVYRVTVRGRVSEDERLRLEKGIVDRGQTLRAELVTIRKASARETHLIVQLTEGKNREIRRMFAATGHDVTALARVAIGALELAGLEPGEWREVSRGEIRSAFPAASCVRSRAGLQSCHVPDVIGGAEAPPYCYAYCLPPTDYDFPLLIDPRNSALLFVLPIFESISSIASTGDSGVRTLRST